MGEIRTLNANIESNGRSEILFQDGVERGAFVDNAPFVFGDASDVQNTLLDRVFAAVV